MMKILKKLKREFVVALSKTCLKSARNNYFGLDLKYPIIQGMGRGYVIPAEAWMGQCLGAFVETKEGCVIDVGANVGVYLVKLRCISDEVEYFGFEPNAVCNYYTNELIRMNHFSRVRVLPLALSDEYGVKTLYASRLGDKSASLVYETKNLSSLEYSSDIYTVPGDDFLKLLNIDKVAAIKIDVEGAELQVLKGLTHTIESRRPYFYTEVWAEYVGGEGADIENRITEIYELMTSRNYIILGVGDDMRLEKIMDFRGLMGRKEPNYIFVPGELLDKFESCIASLENCEVKSRLS